MNDLRQNIATIESIREETGPLRLYQRTQHQIHCLAKALEISEDDWMSNRLKWIDIISKDTEQCGFTTEELNQTKIYLSKYNINWFPELFEKTKWLESYSIRDSKEMYDVTRKKISLLDQGLFNERSKLDKLIKESTSPLVH
jgi:hypothetical protein